MAQNHDRLCTNATPLQKESHMAAMAQELQQAHPSNKNKAPQRVSLSLSIDTLHELLILDGDAGTLTWKIRDVKWFTDGGGRYTAESNANRWNALYAGKPAFASLSGSGYKNGRIFNKAYLAHRVIFAMATGAWPVNHIDHIDGDPLNNSANNLRDVTNQENLKNQKLRPNNVTGHIGVSWNKMTSKWEAGVKVDGTRVLLGYFTDIEDAIAARQAADIEYGFHANHGRAAS